MNQRHFDCPGCGAPLQLSDDQPISRCGHCQTQIAIPRPAEPVDHREKAIAELDAWLDQAIRPYAKRDANGYVIPPPESNVLGDIITGIGMFAAMASFFGGTFAIGPIVGFIGMFAGVLLIAVPGSQLTRRAKKRFQGFKQVEAEYLRRRETLERQFAR